MDARPGGVSLTWITFQQYCLSPLRLPRAVDLSSDRWPWLPSRSAPDPRHPSQDHPATAARRRIQKECTEEEFTTPC